MGYYMGDFYSRGGRNRFMGDPGFFSFLGGLAGKVVGGVSHLLGAGSKVAKIAEEHPQLAAVVKRGAQIVGKHPVLSAAGAASAVGAAGAVAMHSRGSMAAAGMGHAAVRGHGGGGGRHRRMNPCNPKALRRAIRRTHSFAKLAMKTIHLVHPKKHATFGGFKKRRKK
jgi:hypothetical protein